MKLISTSEQAQAYVEDQPWKYEALSVDASMAVRMRVVSELRKRFPAVPSASLPQGRLWDYLYRHLPVELWNTKGEPTRGEWNGVAMFETRTAACYRVRLDGCELDRLDSTDLYLLGDDGSFVILDHEGSGPITLPAGPSPVSGGGGANPVFTPPLLQSEADVRDWIHRHSLKATVLESGEDERIRQRVLRILNRVSGRDLSDMTQGEMWDRAWNYVPQRYDVDGKEARERLDGHIHVLFESRSVPVLSIKASPRLLKATKEVGAYLLLAEGLLVQPDDPEEDPMWIEEYGKGEASGNGVVDPQVKDKQAKRGAVMEGTLEDE